MTAIYHEVLTGEHIRLISILPAADANEQVECEVSQHKYDSEVPPYEALSYVWGDPSVKAKITCNGQPLMVTVNLRDALVRLRLPDSNRVLWADAISINQGSNREKSHYVPLMWKVFSEATRVVVWLGHSTHEEAYPATHSLQIIADACREHEKSPEFDPDGSLPYSSLRLPSETYDAITWKELQQFFLVPWFERVWCVQEIQLARDAVVLWGQEETSHSNIRLSGLWITQRRARNVFNKLGPYQNIRWNNAMAMFGPNQQQESIMWTLDEYRRFKATDQRDKVYGLMNLMSPKARGLLKVDYEQTVAETFAHTAFAAIKEMSDLSVLSFVSHLSEYDGEDEYRSWAPRWDSERKINQLPLFTSIRTEISASKGLPITHSEYPKYNGSLQVRGLLFDRVTSVKDVMYFIRDEVSPQIREFLDERLGEKSSEASRSEPAIQALARTLTAGFTKPSGKPYTAVLGELSAKERETYYGGFIGCLAKNAPLIHKKVFPDFTTESIVMEEDRRYAELMSIACDKRRLFFTETGAYGLGPACLREGDVFVVLFGGDTLYALRPKGNGEFLFLGQAYIDELADGKLVDEMRAGRIREEEFCLI